LNPNPRRFKMLIDEEKLKKLIDKWTVRGRCDSIDTDALRDIINQCRVPMKSPIKAEEKMSKKILVIEDWEKFLDKLNVATLESQCVVYDVKVELLRHELDAIQFEAEACLKFKDGQEVTCIIFRKEPK